ncbi:MAG: type I glyceraldehyde-3-phosphate dehydrogenase [Vicingaceae bacterium]
MTRIGINGFGRIGKYLTRLVIESKDVELLAINDLADIHQQAHLLKYDSVHGRFDGSVVVEGTDLIINGHRIAYHQNSQPSEIPWPVGIDLVIEASGKFTRLEAAKEHLISGVKKVIISAPSPSEGIKTILVGINDHELLKTDLVVSNASCTTNSAGPLIHILDKYCGIESAYITTVHSYTGDQRLHDSPHHDLRRARAGALSIIPTSTGAAKAITKIFKNLDGRIGGAGIRVPVPNGSLTDITCVVKNPMDIAEVNALFKKYAAGDMKNILDYTEDPIVSVDVLGNPHSSIFDAQLTSVIGNMVKVVGWYDNEAGYSNRLVDLIRLMA